MIYNIIFCTHEQPATTVTATVHYCLQRTTSTITRSLLPLLPTTPPIIVVVHYGCTSTNDTTSDVLLLSAFLVLLVCEVVLGVILLVTS